MVGNFSSYNFSEFVKTLEILGYNKDLIII